MGASTRTGEQDGIATATLASGELRRPSTRRWRKRTFDDHYEVGEDPVAFTARDAQRAVTVRFARGYRFAQVFAPPRQPFVCFEPMTATVSALTQPGGCPLVEVYDAVFAVEAGSTMGA